MLALADDIARETRDFGTRVNVWFELCESNAKTPILDIHSDPV